MKRTKQITAALVATTAALLFTGCFDGEGQVKLQAVSKQLEKRGFFSDTYANKPLEGLKILIDEEEMGTTQQGFSSFTLSGGEHTIALARYADVFDEDLYYNKTINVVDKSSSEIVFNLDEIEPKAVPAKGKFDRIDDLISKYDLSDELKFSRSYRSSWDSSWVEDECVLKIPNNKESVFSLKCGDMKEGAQGVNIYENSGKLIFAKKINTGMTPVS